MCVVVSLGALAGVASRRPAAAARRWSGRPLVGRGGAGRAARRLARRAGALPELPLLPATLCRLAVSAARRRAARLALNQPSLHPRCRSRRGDALRQSFVLADSHGCCDLPRA